MKTIVITSPDHWPGEETVIPRLLEAGVDFVHLRKPAWSEADCARLLSLVPAWCHGRIVVHDHFVLCRRFALRGIHLNGRCPEIPVGFEGAVSRSCHSLCEVEEGKPLSSYVFLSPVFDSISKPGYRAAFTPAELQSAARRGIIDRRMVALGGVSVDNVALLRACGFGGVALLGEVWRQAAGAHFDDYLRRLAAL